MWAPFPSLGSPWSSGTSEKSSFGVMMVSRKHHPRCSCRRILLFWRACRESPCPASSWPSEPSSAGALTPSQEQLVAAARLPSTSSSWWIKNASATVAPAWRSEGSPSRPDGSSWASSASTRSTAAILPAEASLTICEEETPTFGHSTSETLEGSR